MSYHFARCAVYSFAHFVWAKISSVEIRSQLTTRHTADSRLSFGVLGGWRGSGQRAPPLYLKDRERLVDRRRWRAAVPPEKWARHGRALGSKRCLTCGSEACEQACGSRGAICANGLMICGIFARDSRTSVLISSNGASEGLTVS